MKKKRLMMTAGCALCLPVVSCTERQDDRPNVLLILADDLGKEWIQQYGAEDIGLPNLQRLADQSVVFDRAYSMAQSTPSRACILTGQYPFNSGWVNHYGVSSWQNGMHFDADRNPCFTKQVKAAGYHTCISGKWQLNDFRVEPDVMTEIGFDEYLMWTGDMRGKPFPVPAARRYWDPYLHSKEGSRSYPGEFGPDKYSDFIIDFIRRHRDGPFFAYYPMALVHMPYVTTPHSLEAKTQFEKHVGMIKYMDFIIGKLLDCLEQEGLMEDTYIIFTTDNGTAKTCFNKRNGRIVVGGKSILSENGVNCPFMIHVPGQKTGRKTQALTDFTDIAPTILDITGSRREEGHLLDGQSLLPVLNGQEQTREERYAIGMGSYPAMINEEGRVVNTKAFRDRVIIGETYKIYLTCDREIDRVYKILEDPFEEHNLVETHLSEALEELGGVISTLPEKDNDFDYIYLPHDPESDIAPEELNALGNSRDYDNFRPLGTERQYLDFRAGKRYISSSRSNVLR